MAAARQCHADPCGDRIISITVPAQILLILLLEILEIGHGRMMMGDE